MITVQGYNQDAAKSVCYLSSDRSSDSQFNTLQSSKVFTALASSSSYQTYKEPKDKDIKQKSKSSDTKPNDEDTTGKQEEDAEEQESTDDTKENHKITL